MGSSRVVLLVDPQDESRVTFQVVLKREGYVVLEARDASEALEQLREGIPDLLIVQMKLPRTSGAELIRMVKGQDHARLRVLALGAESARQEATDARADGFGATPVSPEQLVKVVAGLIGRA